MDSFILHWICRIKAFQVLQILKILCSSSIHSKKLIPYFRSSCYLINKPTIVLINNPPTIIRKEKQNHINKIKAATSVQPASFIFLYFLLYVKSVTCVKDGLIKQQYFPSTPSSFKTKNMKETNKTIGEIAEIVYINRATASHANPIHKDFLSAYQTQKTF